MAKSTRSKTKRAYRRVKREDSVYAVAHAARLDRLGKKLADIANITQPSMHTEEDDDRSEGRLDMDEQGWPIFALFGLIDPDDISTLTIGHDDERQPCSKEEAWFARRPYTKPSDSRGAPENFSAFSWPHLAELLHTGSTS
ncbi:hypothetical protein CPB86DRAFT_786058 [Serendipita vermifera]|nr:hypothetical protein CPB86DRAFT_786058 [Serendipita vermifera]